MPKASLFAAVVASALASPGVALAETTPRVSNELGYFLPRIRVAATVQQIIRRCPASGQRMRIDTTIVISDRVGPDPAAFMRVDLSGGGLTARTTKLGLRPDGTLSAFNATSTGEAGQVISAVIGLGTTIATLGAGGISPAAEGPTPTLTCNDETAERVQRLTQLEAELTALRSVVARGGETAANAQTLADHTAELNDLVGRLTLKRVLAPFVPAVANLQAPAGGSSRRITHHIPQIDYRPWFKESGTALQEGLAAAQILGLSGFIASLTPDGPILDVLARGDGSDAIPTGPTRRFYYRRPVPASFSVAPCASAWTTNGCPPDENATVSAQKSIGIPQFSGAFSLPVGRSNLFGTRQTAATFDEQGAPLTLEYGGTAGGAEIAGVVNAVNAGAAAMRDADTAGNTRRIAEIKAERELTDLLAEPTSE